MLNNGNSNFTNEYKLPSLINQMMSYILKIDFTKPETLFNESILGYENKVEEDEYSNLEQLKEISYYISDPNKVDIDKVRSFGKEKAKDYLLGDVLKEYVKIYENEKKRIAFFAILLILLSIISSYCFLIFYF